MRGRIGPEVNRPIPHLDPVLRPPFSPGGLWLVRPDGYVLLAAKEGAWDEMEAALAAIDAPKSRSPSL